MATFFENVYVDYWSDAANRVYGTLTGDVERSGDTVYLRNLRLALTPTQSSWGTSPFSFTVAGTTTSQTISAPPTTVSLDDASISVSASQTSASVSWSGPEASGSFNISFPARITPPTGLTLSNLTPGTRSFTATVSVSGWGGAGDASSRYRELRASFTTLTRYRYQRQTGNSLSGSITVDNNSPRSGTPFNLTPNTEYYIRYLASNGTETASGSYGNATTLPEAAGLSFVESDGETATLGFQTQADGGKYPKTIQYSLDGGNTWTTAGTVTGGAAESGEFTISGLQLGTTYTVLTRTSTEAGTITGTAIQFTTSTLVGYGSVGRTTKNILRAYGSVNGATKRIVAGYRSVNGVTKKIY